VRFTAAALALLTFAALAQDPPPPPPPPETAAGAKPASAAPAALPQPPVPGATRPELGPPGTPASAAPAPAEPPAPVVSQPAGYQRCVDTGAARFEPARPAAPPETAPPVDADLARTELEAAIKGFEAEAGAYRSEIQQIVQKQFDERRRFTGDHYEQAIRDLEVLERSEREAAIARFEEFIRRYPDDPVYTPDAMFRLAELHYEQATTPPPSPGSRPRRRRRWPRGASRRPSR